MNLHRLSRIVLLASVLIGLSAASFAGVFISVSIAPPPIPVYEQPLCPGPGYIWTPGYWAWGDEGYYWMPGTWVMAPVVGYLWTPGYWGWSGGVYVWNAGYWGPHVGFYGGINYGFGYTGFGYEGGEWRGRDFYYNRRVSNVNVTNITNVYNKTVVVNNNTHVSYNGGRGGVERFPSASEQQYRNERHLGITLAQQRHFQQAAHDSQLLAKNNGGRPTIAATDRPADFRHAVPARSVDGRIDGAALMASPKTMLRNENGNARSVATPSVPRPVNSASNRKTGAISGPKNHVSKQLSPTMSNHEHTPPQALGAVPRLPHNRSNIAGRTYSNERGQRSNVPQPMNAKSFPTNSNTANRTFGTRDVPRPNASRTWSAPARQESTIRQNQPVRQAFQSEAKLNTATARGFSSPAGPSMPQRRFAPESSAIARAPRSFGVPQRASTPGVRSYAAAARSSTTVQHAGVVRGDRHGPR